ncbi:hypothetical protein KCP69_11680 [Salmonella enterica subsp. enterica]|nr:hypothetical protein KCP69_11680 [Salmonella enterica subsp. enterica]
MITLTPQQDESYPQSVELLIGQTLNVDCNRSIASAARWKQKRWKAGATGYVLDKVTSPVSTMMAPP